MQLFKVLRETLKMLNAQLTVSVTIIVFLLLLKCSCLHFPPTTAPTPTIPTSHPRSYLPLALSTCPLYMFLATLPPNLKAFTNRVITYSSYLASVIPGDHPGLE